MREEILAKLAEIETTNNVTILYACEAGSRAWGFESKDSDYDVRFIYKHNSLNDYLSVWPKSDTLQLTDGLLDFSGWDIRKTCGLMSTSNVSLLEWINSPIVYIDKDSTRDFLYSSMVPVIDFNRASMSYWGILKNTYHDYIEKGNFKYKKYFYCLRPIFCVLWVINNKSVPPVLFDDLLADLVLPAEVSRAVQELLEVKRNSDESDGHDFRVLTSYIENKVKDNQLKNLIIKTLPEQTEPVVDQEYFNLIYRDLLLN